MGLKKLKVKWAKKILKKNEEKEAKRKIKEELETEIFARKYKEWESIIQTHTDRLLNELIEDFKKINKPLFKVGEKVIINWYNKGNAWEGNVRQNVQHINQYFGPQKVKITDRKIDKGYYYEYVDKIKRLGSLNDIKENDYRKFKYCISKSHDKHSRLLTNTDGVHIFSALQVPLVGYSYSFVFEEDDEPKILSLREENFLKVNGETTSHVLQYWKYECKQREIWNKIKKLKRKSLKIDHEKNDMAKKYSFLHAPYITNLEPLD